jgi:hypothetical protein
MRYHLDAFFRVQFYLHSKFCPVILETSGIGHPAWNIRDVSFFNFFSSKDSLLEALQPVLMLFVRTLTYLEPKFSS